MPLLAVAVVADPSAPFRTAPRDLPPRGGRLLFLAAGLSAIWRSRNLKITKKAE